MKLQFFSPSDFACPCCGLLPKPELMAKADEIRSRFGSPLVVSSGARCSKHNIEIHGAKASKHLSGEAVDLIPVRKTIDEFHKWAVLNVEALGIWIENPASTDIWLHVQIVPYPSWVQGMTRIFKP